MLKRSPLGVACLLALILAAGFRGAAPSDAAPASGAPPAPIRTPHAGEAAPGPGQAAPLAGEVIVCIAVRDHTTDAPVAGAHVKLTSGSYVDMDGNTGASGELCIMRSLGPYTAHMLAAPNGHVVVRNSLVGAYGSVAALSEAEIWVFSEIGRAHV